MLHRLTATLLKRGFGPEEWWKEVSPPTASGVRLDTDRALSAPAVFAAINSIASAVAMLPLKMYRMTPEGGREVAMEHYLYPVLHDRPNPNTSAMEFREAMQTNLLVYGDAFAEIVRGKRNGRVLELWILDPRSMEVGTSGRDMIYRYGSPRRQIPSDRIFHLRDHYRGAATGRSGLDSCRESIALAVAQEEFASRYFGGDTIPKGKLQVKRTLDDEGVKNLRRSFQDWHRGLGNSGNVLVLEEDMDYENLGVSPEDSQVVEQRVFSVQDVARIFGVPPHRLSDLSRSNMANIEQQSLEFAIYSIGHYAARWEGRIRLDLQPPHEWNEYYPEFEMAALLRSDLKTRYEAYKIGREGGWLSANEIRKRDNLPPIDNGDEYFMPLNMAPVSLVVQSLEANIEEGADVEEDSASPSRGFVPAPTEKRSAAAESRLRLRSVVRPLLLDAASRLVARETKEVLAARKRFAGRAAPSFPDWVREWYGRGGAFRSLVSRIFGPALQATIEEAAALAAAELNGAGDLPSEFSGEYLGVYALRHADSSAGQILSLADTPQDADGADPEEDPVAVRLGEWEARRPEKIANDESVRAIEAVVATVILRAGFTARWTTIGESCPFCQSMNGRSVKGPGALFLPAGGSVFPSGGDIGLQPMQVSGQVGHPPLHQGCDCMVAAG